MITFEQVYERKSISKKNVYKSLHNLIFKWALEQIVNERIKKKPITRERIHSCKEHTRKKEILFQESQTLILLQR